MPRVTAEGGTAKAKTLLAAVVIVVALVVYTVRGNDPVGPLLAGLIMVAFYPLVRSQRRSGKVRLRREPPPGHDPFQPPKDEQA